MPQELRILIVEDLPQDADAIQRELHAEGLAFKSKRLETRAEFLAELERGWADIVLSDFTLPEFNALEALELLRQAERDIPFILVTGTRSEEVAVECLRQGADDYILKASLKRLPASIRNALDKKEAQYRRSRAESALRESEEQFRLIAEHSRDLIGVLTPEATFLYASPAFRTGLGLAPSRLLGSCFLTWSIPRTCPPSAATGWSPRRPAPPTPTNAGPAIAAAVGGCSRPRAPGSPIPRAGHSAPSFSGAMSRGANSPRTRSAACPP